MAEEEKGNIIARLKRIEGQIRGLQRMIEEERGCEEVITQMSAARAALDSAAQIILRHHMGQCLSQTDPEQRERNLQKALELLFKIKA